MFAAFAGRSSSLVCTHHQLMCPDRLRGSGTAATNMCLVATGAVEAFFEIGIHCWDIAAGAVIVQEAGGVLMDVDGVYYWMSYKLNEWMNEWDGVRECWGQQQVFVWTKVLLFDTSGGPFDLMSRRMLSANNNVIAERITKEIEIFPVTRDDAPIPKKWVCMSSERQ